MAKRAGKRLATARRRSERRGVLLLAVLSILVLFLLVGTTFLITSGQYRTASKVQEKAVRTTFQPADVLERALMQLLRDTNNPSSVVRYHSLLRDLYGVDGFVGRPADTGFSARYSITTISEITPLDRPNVLPHYAGVVPRTLSQPLGPTDGQLIEFYVYDDPTIGRLDPSDRNTVGLDFGADGLPVEHQLPAADGYYNGCVLTFITGPCRGSSVRVIDYDHIQTGFVGNEPIVPVARFRTTAPRRSDGRPLQIDLTNGVLTDLVDGDPTVNTVVGHRFIVNGRPFNGTGVGFNPLALSHDLEQSAPSPRLSAIEALSTTQPGGGENNYGLEVALTPNATQYNRSRIAHLKSNRFRDPFTEGLTFNQGNPTSAGNDYVYLNSDPANAFAELANPRYGNFAGPGDTDESYDAPDTQNMALALQSPEPRLRGRVVVPQNATSLTPGTSVDPAAYYANESLPPAYLDLDGVTIPSFHRPALANFWFHRLYNSGWLSGLGPAERVRLLLEPYNADGSSRVGDDQTSAQVAAIKRKFLMRPLREDHPDFDGSNALSRYGTDAIRTALDGGALVNPDTGEITFPVWEAVGPWDVDNDGDGVPDSVWVDVGLPVQKTEDGRWYKPLVAMLVEDLDGRLNLNAHGSLDDLASLDQIESENLDASVLDQTPDDPTDNLSTDWFANLAQDYGNNGPLYSSDQLSTGEGWGPAEVSLRSILSPGLPLAGLTNQIANTPATQSFEGNPQFDDYARLLAGRPDPALGGRTVETALQVAEPFGRYGSVPSDLAFGAINGVQMYRPGRSFVALGGGANQALSEATADPLTVYERVGAPDYVFTNNEADKSVDLPNVYSSPPNQRGRYAQGLTAAGAPVSEATNAANLLRAQAIIDGTMLATDPLLTWRQDVLNTPNDSPYELNLSPGARRLLPVSIAAIRSSYDSNGSGTVDTTAAPLNDDAPFSVAELERLLRALDADAPALPDRLWNLVDAFDPIKLAAATRLERVEIFGDPTLRSPSLDAVAAAAKAAINRRSVTTDSWDLPVPNENWSERLTLGADGLPGVPWNDSNLSGNRDLSNAPTRQLDVDDQGDDDGDGLYDEGDEAIVGYDATTQTHTFTNGGTATYEELFLAGCDDYVVVMRRDPPASPRITDYLRYRITLELLRNGTIGGPESVNPPPTPRTVVEKHLDEILIGSNIRPATPNVGGNVSLVRSRSNGGIDNLGVAGADMRLRPPLFSYGGLLAPELLAGLRMDLNRPLGDGRDNGNGIDDDNNGLVDDPAEMRSIGMAEDEFVIGQSFPNPYDLLLNGIVDEPGEAGEPAADRNQNGTIDDGEYLDRNRNGFYDPPRDVLWAADLDGDGSLLVDRSVPLNQGGVYDPAETTPFNYTAGADANGNGAFLTTNREGEYTGNEPLILDDGPAARQLMARHLYCLMLSLMDENYVAPYDPNDLQVFAYLNPNLGPSIGTLPGGEPYRGLADAYGLAIELFNIEFATEIANGTLLDSSGANMVIDGEVAYGSHTLPMGLPSGSETNETRRLGVLAEARSIAQRKLTRRMIAQWAVNVVDFRDSDAIQTAFEYDENPWDGWNVIDTVGQIDPVNFVYPLDGDLATDESRGQVRDPQQASFPVLPDPVANPWENLTPVRVLDQSRGVVWGAERPELLLTEGLAWHDRRAIDTEIQIKAANSGAKPAPEDYDGGVIAPGDGDDDLDQVIRPKGFTYLEAYNPWTGDPQRPADFYSHIDQDGVMKLEAGLRLDRLSTEAYAFDQLSGPVRSPVWRIAVVEEDPRLRNTTLTAPVSAAGSTGAPLDYWVSDDPDPFGDILAPNFPASPTLGGAAWEKLPNVWDNTGFADQEPYFDLNAERTRAAVVAVENDSLTVAFDADGVALSLGLRETTPPVPDTSFPTFDRFVLPIPTPNTVPVPISSFIDGDANGQVERQRFSKPVRHIERAIYPVTPFAATDPKSLGGRNGLAFPNVEPLSSDQYDASGYRIPVRELRVELSTGGTANTWTRDFLWNFSARPDRSVGLGLAFNTSRFGAFDWFDLDSDGNRFDERSNAAGDRHIEAVEISPLLPGRRAVIGTQGSLYQNSEITSIKGVLTERARFLANTPEPDNDPLGPSFLEGRFTAFTAPEPSIYDQNRNLPPRISRLGRIEMIPSTEADQHQVAVRMNGLTESITAFQGPGMPNPGNSYNMTVAPAAGVAAARTGPPVIAVPIDNFSVTEPIDQYLLRILELDPGLPQKANFVRRDIITEGSPGATDYAFAEGYFERTSGVAAQLGFDEPFDVLPELIKNQTTPNYRSVHLERLANPLLPWNPPPYQPQQTGTTVGGNPIYATSQHDPTRPINPYLPVDALPLDVTALNTLGEEDQSDAQRGNARHVRTTAAPHDLHRLPRALPRPLTSGVTTGKPADRDRNPFVARSVERDRPWGAFRSLWGATGGRMLWRQARPTSASELVIGTSKIQSNGQLAVGDATGDLHIATVTVDDQPQITTGSLSGPPEPAVLASNGFDLTYEYQQAGYDADDPTETVLGERVYQFGWRMTLGFASPGMGRPFLGGNLLWRSRAAKFPAPEQVDLDGDGSASDLLGFADLSESFGNVFADTNANGRPDALENINWDFNDTASGKEDFSKDRAVVDAHEAAQNRLRDQTATPELHWPNRPFASAGELLQVPAWGGSRMLTHFSAFNWLHTQGPEFRHHTQVNPYNGEAAVMHDGLDYPGSGPGVPAFDGNFANDETAANSRDSDNYLDYRATNELRFRETLGHFGHLTNFFQTARYPAFVQASVETDFPSPSSIGSNPSPPPVNVATPVPRGAAHFYRVLDYVHVPTPFTASKTLLNPNVFGQAGLVPGDVRAGLSAPFNSIDGYREPGRVNLNTIVGRRDRGADPSAAYDWWSEVYDGLMQRTQDTSVIDFDNEELLKMGHLGPAWRDVALSRRGYVQSTFDPNQDPTDLSMTLATPAQNRLDYSPRRMHPDFPTFFANPFRAPGEGANVPLAHMVQTGVDATMLRAHPLSPGADGAWGRRGQDDRTVDKGGDPNPPNGDTLDGDLIRDDASEAGFLTPANDPTAPAIPATLELGGGGSTVPVPAQPTIDRLSADVVLARFRHSRQELGGVPAERLGRRGALPDTLLDDALRPNLAHFFDPRDVSPGQSSAPGSLPAISTQVLPGEDPDNFEDPTIPFANTEIGRRVTPVPLFSGATIEPSLDTERNATKRFQPIQRMSSLATTRSNVYAVWITVGFFEVKPASEDLRVWPRYMTDANGDGIGDTFIPNPQQDPPGQEGLANNNYFFQVYPEGWTLGKELGFDTGTNARHRGFYMIDRSRPVAFRPGEDANVSDAVLVRRRLE